jgi:hypothetical protein
MSDSALHHRPVRQARVRIRDAHRLRTIEIRASAARDRGEAEDLRCDPTWGTRIGDP